MKKKTLTMLIALVLVLACGVGATLAYLMDKTGPVTNTFTAGDVDITLAESTGTTYKMVPGNTIKKDPTVTVVEGSEDCYVYVEVKKDNNFDSYVTAVIDSEWTKLEGVEGDVYWREAKAGDVFSVLANDQVTVKADVTKTMMDAIDGVDENGNTVDTEKQPEISFTAYAIQKANISSAAAGWTELKK